MTLTRWLYLVFFFQAEDGIRDLVRSRGLGDVYKRQECDLIGLGVSAISKVGNSYSQGVRTVSAYYQHIDLSLIHI